MALCMFFGLASLVRNGRLCQFGIVRLKSDLLLQLRLGELHRVRPAASSKRQSAWTAIMTIGAVTFFSSFRSSDLSQSI